MAKKYTRQDLREAAEKYKNWGNWGPNDEIGTLNYTTPEDIVAAARLVRKGKVISLALNFDHTGPQGAKSKYPAMGRINPVHTMLRTGTDAYSGVLDHRGIRAADDMVVMPLQCGTQWDGLGHVFYENYMWNGYDCREVTSAGAQKCGIEKTKNKMVGRGVFLDVRALQGHGLCSTTATPSPAGPRRHREEAERRGQARRLRHRAHRPDGALPERAGAGTAIRAATRRASPSRRWMDQAHRARRARERHLGLRGAPERERARHQPALALDHHPDHGHDHGRDLLR